MTKEYLKGQYYNLWYDDDLDLIRAADRSGSELEAESHNESIRLDIIYLIFFIIPDETLYQLIYLHILKSVKISKIESVHFSSNIMHFTNNACHLIL